jgi:hypothetical protein
MKRTKWLGLMAVMLVPLLRAQGQEPAPQGAASVPANISPVATEVTRLAESGTSEDVMLAYIQNSAAPFNLSADQILYLKDIGLPSAVITAMLNRDIALRGQPQTYNYEQRAYPPTAAPPAAVAPAPVAAPPPAPEAVTPPPAPAPPPVYVSTPPPDVGYFYDQLSPYGSWVQLEGVGWCWQPRVVVINRSWQPYCDSGHWIWTDAGWCWVSDYSWGWAPFHYGRWHQHARCGWVWLPDRAWGPAWVAWRSEGDHCGWAPLPPHSEFVVGVGWRFNGVAVGVNFDFGLRPQHFTFVALHDFNQHDLGHRRLPPTEVTRIYNHTTVINNYTVNNKTVINQGIGVQRVAAATHTEIRPVPIRDVPAGAGRPVQTQGGGKSGTVVYRPQLTAPTRTSGIVAQKVDERHPVIQHTPVAAVAPRQQHTPTLSTTGPGNTSKPWGTVPTQGQTGTAQRDVPRNADRSGSAQAPAGWPSAPSAASAPSAPSAMPAPRAMTGRPEANPHLYPLRTGQPQVTAPQPGVPRQPAPQYYPKSYHQAAEAHALPPLDQYGTAPVSPPAQGHGSSSKKDN